MNYKVENALDIAAIALMSLLGTFIPVGLVEVHLFHVQPVVSEIIFLTAIAGLALLFCVREVYDAVTA